MSPVRALLLVGLLTGCSPAREEARVRGVVFGSDFSGKRAFGWIEPGSGTATTATRHNLYVVEPDATCGDFEYGAEGERRVTSFIVAANGETSGYVAFERVRHWHEIETLPARPATITLLKTATRTKRDAPDSGARFGRLRIDARASNGDFVSGEIDYELCR